MKILERGHVYELAELDRPAGDIIHNPPKLTFVNREPGREHPGTQTQEVLRCLIDRTYHCDSCLPNELNAMIIYHLRMAIVFHEMRALQRKAEKGLYRAEEVELAPDGHYDFGFLDQYDMANAAPRREFVLQPPVPMPNHPKK